MSVLRNINYIKRQSGVHCAEPGALLMIETAFVAAPPALLQLFVPGCSEILQASLGINPTFKEFEGLVKGAEPPKPKGRRGRHGKIQTGTIGQVIAPTNQGGRQFLYKIGFFGIQKALWYWQVAEVTTEFIATWQSIIHEEQGCDLPDLRAYHRQLPSFIYTEGNTLISLSPFNVAPCIGVSTSTIIIQPGCSASIMWSATWQGWPVTSGPVGNASTWLEQVGVGEPLGYGASDDDIGSGSVVTGGFHRWRGQGTVNPTAFRIMCQVEPAQTGMQIVNGFLSITPQGYRHNSTFGCKPSTAFLGDLFS